MATSLRCSKLLKSMGGQRAVLLGCTAKVLSGPRSSLTWKEKEELPSVPLLLQRSNRALSVFHLTAHSPSREAAQRETPQTLPWEKLHSPLLPCISLRSCISGCHTAAPQRFCQKRNHCQFKVCFYMILFPDEHNNTRVTQVPREKG